jgi:hypothetical protein
MVCDVYMSEEDIRKEVVGLRERIVRLEVKVDDLTNRIESLAKCGKEHSSYLQKQATRF